MSAICVFCASSTAAPQRWIDLAAEVGSAIAVRGHSLVSGGGNVSSMGAVARAARDGGAHTFGVIPRALLDLEVADTDSDELVVVEDMRSRKQLMDDAADAFLALPGGIGTLEELLEVWTSRSLGLHSKPVVVLDPDGLYDPLREQVGQMQDLGLVRTSAVEALKWTTGVDEALDLIEAELSSRERL